VFGVEMGEVETKMPLKDPELMKGKNTSNL